MSGVRVRNKALTRNEYRDLKSKHQCEYCGSEPCVIQCVMCKVPQVRVCCGGKLLAAVQLCYACYGLGITPNRSMHMVRAGGDRVGKPSWKTMLRQHETRMNSMLSIVDGAIRTLDACEPLWMSIPVLQQLGREGNAVARIVARWLLDCKYKIIVRI